MFGWFRKKSVTREADTEAFRLGERVAQEIFASFDHFMKSRFCGLHDNYLNVLRGNFQTDIGITDAPPMTAARIHYEIFLDEVSYLKQKMNDEVAHHMNSWIEIADETGCRPHLEQFFQQEVSKFCDDLAIAGRTLFTDYAIPLKDADVSWRKVYPELAEKFPEK